MCRGDRWAPTYVFVCHLKSLDAALRFFVVVLGPAPFNPQEILLAGFSQRQQFT